MTKPNTSTRHSLTTADLARARARLDSELFRLREELVTAGADATTYVRCGATGDDPGDLGAAPPSRIDRGNGAVAEVRLLMQETTAALKRIEYGTYGTCESCTHPIGVARLGAFPRVTLCLHCRDLVAHHWPAIRPDR
ncbi:TraR/DksA family transcriptional regulator [Flexivirga alba]|uniref:TraR/DksA family transcriptional regulator n=1 Tax=Flexivirga alba TaxID=702742 RepID=A0ABW2AJQ3_9MICO